MSKQALKEIAISAFCESMGLMLSAGIGPQEASALLLEDSSATAFTAAAAAVNHKLNEGASFAEAVQQSGYFPPLVGHMIGAGETTGRTEQVLKSLSKYYAGQHQLQAKLKSALIYPALLLILMILILAFLLAKVLPVFTGVYESLSGSIAASSYSYIQFAGILGWVALGITLVLTLVLLAGSIVGRTLNGRTKLVRFFAKLPLTASATRQLSLAHFTQILSLFLNSGVEVEASLEAAAEVLNSNELAEKVAKSREQVAQGENIAQAFFNVGLLEPLYGRMLLSASRSGNTEQVLEQLSDMFHDDAELQIDRLINSIEPSLSGFLTISVGITLICVMLPLIGILSAMG